MKNRYEFIYPVILLLFLVQFGDSLILSLRGSYDQVTFNLIQFWNFLSNIIAIYFFNKICNTNSRSFFMCKSRHYIIFNMLLCFIAGILLNTFNEWVYILFPRLTELINLKAHEKMILFSDNIFYYIYVGIIVPIVEEIIFRRFFFSGCCYEFGYKKSIFIGALVWAIIHMNPSQVLYVFVIGIILNIIYAETSNILYTIAIHIGINVGGTIGIFKKALTKVIFLFNIRNSEILVALSAGILAIICIMIVLYINQRVQHCDTIKQ